MCLKLKWTMLYNWKSSERYSRFNYFALLTSHKFLVNQLRDEKLLNIEFSCRIMKDIVQYPMAFETFIKFTFRFFLMLLTIVIRSSRRQIYRVLCTADRKFQHFYPKKISIHFKHSMRLSESSDVKFFLELLAVLLVCGEPRWNLNF